NNNNISTSDVTHQKANYYLHKYRSYIDTLHANKSVEGSTMVLMSPATAICLPLLGSTIFTFPFSIVLLLSIYFL
ncbi:MAG: hypothetical protein WCA39_00205, partial [Nitrososphaeraceae archaeon]